jgi:hypothetical protein
MMHDSLQNFHGVFLDTLCISEIDSSTMKSTDLLVMSVPSFGQKIEKIKWSCYDDYHLKRASVLPAVYANLLGILHVWGWCIHAY